MIKCFEKRTKSKKKLLEISDKFSSNFVVCKQILELIKNNSTHIKIDKDIKNSYYVFLNDTIYISDIAKNTSGYQRICVIAHECVHSIQNKRIQIINFILSNLELMSFIISIICILFKYCADRVFSAYLILNVISIIPRLILEIDATIKSIDLSKKYVENKLDEFDTNILINAYKSKIKLFSIIFILYLILGKLLRLLVVYLLSYILK